MKKLYWSVLCAAIWLVSQGMASATPVLFTDSALITISGETFTFTETALVPSLSGGVFTIMAQGDYDWGDSFEYLTWDIDGYTSPLAINWGPSTVGIDFYDDTAPANNVSWFHTWTIPTITMNSILADDEFTVTITNSSDVDAVQATDFVSYTLQYFDGSTSGTPVPEPTTLLLLGSGLIGLAGLRRKVKSRGRS